MRDYGKVFSSFWTSQTIRTLSEDARAMAIYLITCPHGTISGAFRLPDGYVCDDLQWSSERVNLTLIELLHKGFCNRCETTKWLWINKHFDWNKPENPNQFKSAAKIVELIPDECSWKLEYMRLNAYFLGIDYKPLDNPSATLSKPVTVTVTVTEAVVVTETVPVTVGCAAENSATPEKIIVDTEFQSACKKTWKSYSDAYWERYNVEPVRNQKVNSIIKNFVQRVGQDESPHIAAHYLQNNSSWYIQKGHAVDGLLADAEKLRTEWATGRTMTRTRASQIDKSQSNKSAVNEAMEILERG